MVFIFECIKNFFVSWAIPMKALLSYVVIWSLLSTKQDDSTPINMTIAMLPVDLILSIYFFVTHGFYGLIFMAIMIVKSIAVGIIGYLLPSKVQSIYEVLTLLLVLFGTKYICASYLSGVF